MELNGLKTKFLGRNVIFYKSIDSTQKKAKSLRNLTDGTVIIADNQTAGVGTHDRKWYTGNRDNIAMSFVLLPNCNIKNIENLTMCVAECLVEALEKVSKLKVQIKIPNDIYYNNKKLCGILVESVCKGECIKKICIGVGINVNQKDFPGNLGDIATSLKIETGNEFQRDGIIVEFLNKFEEKYEKMLEKEGDAK